MLTATDSAGWFCIVAHRTLDGKCFSALGASIVVLGHDILALALTYLVGDFDLAVSVAGVD